ncbi:MAG TPA: hypothetical protein VN628_02410 [Vicinamibacterales bacterium]|nr:hypothetical protein [Vicinamibacterales bacterium]
MRTSPIFRLITVGFLALPAQLYAQRPPAIPGTTGTIVTPETAKEEKKVEDKVAPAVKDALTPDNKAKGPLADLIPGTTVVIRFGDNVTEGVVSKIDFSANEITVRYDNKKVETFVLADKAGADTRRVDYTNDTKQRVTRYFRLKS